MNILNFKSFKESFGDKRLFIGINLIDIDDKDSAINDITLLLTRLGFDDIELEPLENTEIINNGEFDIVWELTPKPRYNNLEEKINRLDYIEDVFFGEL